MPNQTVKKLKQANLVCGVVYKPPDINDSKLDQIFKLLSELFSTEPNILIMGDFNINLKAESYKTRKLLDHLSALSFKLIVTNPTCHKSGSSSTIDIFSGNCTSNVNNVYQSSVGGFSDHDLICLDYKFKNPKANSHVYWTREYHKIEIVSFTSDLRRTALNNVFNCASANEKLRCFNDLFLEILDGHAPLKRKIITNPNCPWIDNHINRLFKNRSDAYECWKREHWHPRLSWVSWLS